jgi:hypothetical protein
MKSLAYILLLSMISVKAFLPNMDLCCDLHRIPAFFDHYQVHKVQYGDTFWEFVEGHYFYNDDNYEFVAEDPDHANLPFRESHQSLNNWVFYTPSESIALSEPSFPPAAKLGFHMPGRLAKADISPFQPPRIS